MEPEGWPGHVWLEGRTSVHLRDHQDRPSHMPRGPAAKIAPTMITLEIALVTPIKGLCNAGVTDQTT